MAVREIRKYPDEILRRRSLNVEDFNDELDSIINDMIETMYSASGIGLAAPQIGESKRIIVIDTSWKEDGHPLLVLVNPEIVESEGLIDSEEGCLSVPKHLATVKRKENILVKGIGRDMKPLEIECSRLLARVIQHEIDHLNGVLFFDHLSLIKREFFKKKYIKSLSK